MKFEFVKIVDGEVMAYEGKMVRTGEIVEFSDQFAAKAIKNPDYKLVGDKRKYTRKVKVGDQD